MHTDPPNRPLILASQSPRRRYLLEQAGLRFEVVPSGIDEAGFALTSPDRYVRRLAEAKALDVAAAHPDAWVIGADTIVLIDATVLGKPGGREEARAMLQRLSGRTHQVYTGYSICCRRKERTLTDVAVTDVTFKTLSDDEIEWYIHTDEPFDKAGAYAIQGLGTFLVRRINGSYTNVVGLPVCEVIEVLIEAGAVGLNRGGRN
jgi:septum formation protein